MKSGKSLPTAGVSDATQPTVPPRNMGQVFTPPFLAEWTADLLATRLPQNHPVSVLDPACGDGALLAATEHAIHHAVLYGADIDPAIVRLASKRLRGRAKIRTQDMLESVRCAADCFGPVDAVISNPPWGADLAASSSALRKAGFSLANGQYDSWVLFLEASLCILKPDGLGVFILPDAIFLPEHAPVRHFLASACTLDLIARLGEGVFRHVYRGTTVVVFRKRLPTPDHRVRILRLPWRQRGAVVHGNADLADIHRCSSSTVLQSRFLRDEGTRWDIDVPESDERTVRKIESIGGDWSLPLETGRGVEISKRGLVARCPNCSLAIPKPIRRRQVLCKRCKHEIPSVDMQTGEVVKPLDGDCLNGYIPFVVGEDVDRYQLTCSRQIQLHVPGLNYKPLGNYTKERLLIRKTGVGLKATITDRYAATNQVVFSFWLRQDFMDQKFYLPYVLGVLSSRIMFAYHLQKGGENEWRSHPYVTPKSLRRLPIPLPESGTQLWAQARAIATEVRRHLRGGGRSRARDLRIERLVAGLYQLDRNEIAWAKRVITSAQGLEPMRALGRFDTASVRPIHAEELTGCRTGT